jgi:LmbE family N-acetylglucosaminyl deacetylase
MSKLMIVAHPDDEVLFGGLQLLQYNWKVICITNKSNPTRKYEFEQVMHLTNSDYEMWDYLDEMYKPFLNQLLINDIKSAITGYDYILSHNPDGEYGHPHHIQINRILTSILNEFYVFNFGKFDSGRLTRKKELLKIYQSQNDICCDHWLLAGREINPVLNTAYNSTPHSYFL